MFFGTKLTKGDDIPAKFLKNMYTYLSLNEIKFKVNDYINIDNNMVQILGTCQIVDNKICILESITNHEVNKVKVKDVVLEEFKSYDKDLRTLTYHVLLENFNTKYDGLSKKQKTILKEFINSADNGPLLKEFYNKEITNIKLLLEREIKKVKDQTTKIKLKEVNKLILELNKRTTVKNNHLVDLLQYHSLLEELTGANG